MDKRTDYGSALRIALGMACFVIIVAGMKAASDLVVPFLMSAFIAIICAPGLNWLQRKGLPIWAALAVVIALVALIGSIFVSIIGGSIHNFTTQLPEYQRILAGYIEAASNWLNRQGLDWYDAELRKMFNPGVVLGFVGGVFSGLGNMLGSGFMIFLTVAFLLFEGSSFPGKIRAMATNADDQIALIREFFSDVNRYIAIKTWTSLGTGVLITIWLAILGVDYAMLWGLLAFLLNYIPNIGSIIAAVPAVLLALVSAGPVTAVWATVGYLVVNTTVGNIIEPKFLGDRLGLSTLVVFLSLVFWGWVLGTTGMFLSVPLTMVVKLALETNDETRWIAILLGSGEHDTKEEKEVEQAA